jgi:protein-tyrosine phosphatase
MAADLKFTDLHCHLAPGIDDGAKSWDDTLAMARQAVAEGIGTVVCTPHQCGSYSHTRGDQIRDLVADVQTFLEAHGVPLHVLPGADVRIEPDLVGRLRSGNVLTLADQRRHVLLELPHELYVPLDKLLDDLAAAKMTGILSHPERNQGILAQPELIQHLVDRGCLMQVTSGSLLGAFGPNVRHCAEYLVSSGLTHFISTDAHSPRSRRPQMRATFEHCQSMVGYEAARAMFVDFPAAVAAGQSVPQGKLTTVHGKATRATAGWFGWRKSA